MRRYVWPIACLVAFATTLAVVGQAKASYPSMVYNFSGNGTYDAAGATFQIPASVTASATIKGAISTNNDQAQAGW